MAVALQSKTEVMSLARCDKETLMSQEWNRNVLERLSKPGGARLAQCAALWSRDSMT
jgi:hypothetical protein